MFFRIECVHVLCYFGLMSAQTRYPVDSLFSVGKCPQCIFSQTHTCKLKSLNFGLKDCQN